MIIAIIYHSIKKKKKKILLGPAVMGIEKTENMYFFFTCDVLYVNG